MKKKSTNAFLHSRKVKKWFLMMKLTMLLILAGLMQVSATVYSQATKFNFRAENKQVVEVLNEIEESSDFRFFYIREQVDVERKVTVRANGATVEQILDELFAGQGISYKVMDDNMVLLSPDVSIKKMESVVSQQQNAVSGKVTDTAGQPLPGVTVVVKGTTQGTVTNADGNYSLSSIPENATLVFSFIGMKTQEVVVGNQTSINISMMEDAIGLEEVVAIGYGTQKKVNMTGSVVSVKSEDLMVAPVGNVTNTLAGRLPGLFAKQESGAPGSDAARLSIRGFGNALTIVDGVERSFNSLDPNEIESISVLKDGAAAIYGSRAGNGVILVTTKKGNISKPVLTYNGSYSINQWASVMEQSSSGQWAEMLRERDLNQGLTTPMFTEEQVKKYYEGTDPDYPNTNWINEVTRPNTPMQQHNLSLRGGSEKMKYYAYLGYLDQPSTFKKEFNGGGYKRYNFRSNMEANITDNLKMQVNFSYINGTSVNPGRGLALGGIFQDLYESWPTWAGSLPDKTKVPYTGTAPVKGNADQNVSGYNRTNDTEIQGNMALDWDIKWVKGLKARAFFDYSQLYRQNKNFVKNFKSYSYSYSSNQYIQRQDVNATTLSYNNNTSTTINGQFSLNYDRTFAKDHVVSAFALYEITDYKGGNVFTNRSGYITTAVDYLFAGTASTATNNDGAFEMGRASYAGRLNYAYKSKYLFESTLRYDASAKFPDDTRWGLFPSVSLGWRISEENFMKNSIPSMDNLKLRASYSESGYDAIGNFQYLAGYQFGQVYGRGATAQSALYDMSLPNPTLTWETMTTYNLGLDMSLWKRKLYGEFDVFYRKREGIMGTRAASLPSTFGASAPQENLNSSDDRGFEATLGTAGSKNDFRYDISGNVAWARSKWLAFDEPNYTDPDDIRLNKKTGQWVDRAIAYVAEKQLFASQEEINNLPYNQDGQNPKNKTLRPGDIKIKDLNGDGVINWRDQAEVGKGLFPHWLFGLNTNLTYKNIDCSMLFQGAADYSNFINYRSFNDVKTYENRWSPANPDVNAYVPRLGGAGYVLKSDRFIQDIAYVRLKTLSVGYTLPAALTKKINWESVRFYFAATNLFTLSTISEFNVDPEAPATYRENFRSSYYPQQRTLSFGVNISL
jgi:TonB-linked SusC/RagA family outer membrane protein